MALELVKTAKDAFDGVFVMRLIVGTLFAGAAAWGVSFYVSDYVVKANTSSSNEAMRSLQSSIENFNTSFQTTTLALQASIDANTRSTDNLEGQMSELLRRSEIHSVTLSGVQTDLGRVATAVQNAGIEIRIGSNTDLSGKVLDWNVIREAYGINSDDSFFLKVPTAPN